MIICEVCENCSTTTGSLNFSIDSNKPKILIKNIITFPESNSEHTVFYDLKG